MRLVVCVLVLSYAGAAALAAGGTSVVFSASWEGGGLLEVLSDDSYTVSVGGKAWLQNGTTAVFIDGVWYSTTAAAASDAPSHSLQCKMEIGIDYNGNDLYFVNDTQGADVCCDLCSKEPACKAWTWTGLTSSSSHSSPSSSAAANERTNETSQLPPWANRCYLKSSTSGREAYAGHTAGIPSGREAPLQRVGAQPYSGSSPSLGDFRGWNISYVANRSTPFVVSFIFYPQSQLLVFTQWFPQGASAINITHAVNSTSSPAGADFVFSMQPSTLFPTFLPAAQANESSFGYLTWRGRFAGTSFDAPTTMCSALSNVGGSQGGPLVLFDGTAPASSLSSALVWSSFNNFKATILGQVAAPSSSAYPCMVGAGVGGYVTSLPANYTASFALFMSDLGINGAMDGWGQALQRAYGTKRLYDPSSSLLTYWTDNGAYYDFYAYEPDINSKGLVEDILVDLANTFVNGTYPGPPLPVHHFMLDAYWMYNVRPNCNCKLNDTVWPLPFPHGLPWLVERLGNKPLILYNGPQCVNSTYADTWPLVNSLYFDVGWAVGALSLIDGPSSYAFYSQLFERADLPMISFTQDFLDFNYLIFPAWLESSQGNYQWLEGQARAAFDHNMTVQYCMALPSDFMASLEFPAVTNARASGDYVAGLRNWKMGGTSLLISAVGLKPSKDNFWSGSKGTDRRQETSPYLNAIVCALSGGPVGFADKLFYADPAVLWPTMRLDGVLLHPSRPATTIDGVFLMRSAWVNSDVRVSGSIIPASSSSSDSSQSPLLFHNVLVAGPAAFSVPSLLTPNDLYPLIGSQTYWMWQYNNSACGIDGTPARLCVSLLVDHFSGAPQSSTGDNAGSERYMSGDAVEWTLWSCTPGINGYIFLGEVDKYVPVSPDRFASIVPTPTGIQVSLEGAANESVKLAYVNDMNVVRVVTVVIDASGKASVLLS